MRAGRLRNRVTLQKSLGVPDSYGQPIRSWVNVVTVWAGVENINGREQYRAQAERAELTHLVLIRYRPDVGPVARVLYGSRVLDVESVVDPDNRRQDLHLLCREQVA